MRGISIAGLVLALAVPLRAADELVPLTLTEPVQDKSQLPLLAVLDEKDPRQAEAVKLADNEAARFIRRLLARVSAKSKRPLQNGLVIALEKGGNHAVVGHRLKRGSAVEALPEQSHVLLELHPNRMSHTLLHEGGHVVHALVRARAKRPAPWTPLPHSTFAVTEPETALAEGYASHLEALWGHFGSDPTRRGFYHHDGGPDAISEAFHPVVDLLSYSQAFSRYQSVRDGLPAFANTHAGSPPEYLRAQLDPERDRSLLKGPQALIASEGVVASVLFRAVAGRAIQAGARPGAGLDQPALLQAEEEVVASLAAAESATGPFRPDLVDVATAAGPARDALLDGFLAQTRGVTARPALAVTWRRLWNAALALDGATVKDEQATLATALGELSAAAKKDPAVLRAALGPVIPVRLPQVRLTVYAFGDSFPLEVDLNALSAAELAFMPEKDRARIAAERTTAPFKDIKDFETRTKTTLGVLGLEPVTP